MGVDRRSVHRLIAGAACPCCVPAAVAETGLMTASTSPGPSGCPFGHRVGGWVIHFPAVVLYRSPTSIAALCLEPLGGMRTAAGPSSVVQWTLSRWPVDGLVAMCGTSRSCAHHLPEDRLDDLRGPVRARAGRRWDIASAGESSTSRCSNERAAHAPLDGYRRAMAAVLVSICLRRVPTLAYGTARRLCRFLPRTGICRRERSRRPVPSRL